MAVSTLFATTASTETQNGTIMIVNCCSPLPVRPSEGDETKVPPKRVPLVNKNTHYEMSLRKQSRSPHMLRAWNRHLQSTLNLPTNITPANIAWVKLWGKFPMGMRIPPLEFKIMLESNPLKSRILVGRLAVFRCLVQGCAAVPVVRMLDVGTSGELLLYYMFRLHYD